MRWNEGTVNPERQIVGSKADEVGSEKIDLGDESSSKHRLSKRNRLRYLPDDGKTGRVAEEMEEEVRE